MNAIGDIKTVSLGDRRWVVVYAFIDQVHGKRFELSLTSDGAKSFQELLWKQSYPHLIKLHGCDEILTARVEMLKWAFLPEGAKLIVEGIIVC